MYNLNSNRRWKRVIAVNQMHTCNRAARRAAARIQAALTPNGPAPTADSPSVATVQRVYTRPYVGINPDGFYVMFRAKSVPEGYTAVMGPFKTTRAAQYALDNPDVISVAVAERMSKE